MTGAPLRAASKHAKELLARESDDPVAEAAANFAPSRCLEWLQRSAAHTSTNTTQNPDWPSSDSEDENEQEQEQEQEQRPRPPVAKFKVFDLVEGKYLFGQRPLGVEEELTLPVSPSGVRAIRLEAI